MNQRIANLVKNVNRILEARKVVKYEVGGIVHTSDGETWIEVNGKPAAHISVYPDDKVGKDMLVITTLGKDLFVYPSGPDSSITADDMNKIKEDIQAIWMGKPTKYFGREQAEKEWEERPKMSSEPILGKSEKVIITKEFPEYGDMIEYIQNNILEEYYDLENMGWNFPNEENSLITEFTEDSKPVYFCWVKTGDKVKAQWAETEDGYKLYIIKCPEKIVRKQGTNC